MSALVVSAIGFLRIFAYLKSGQLWLPMGMHAGWNFFQGPVFGLPVSGRGSESLLSTKLGGPLWATGGGFGLEAGGFGLVYALLGAAAVLLWVTLRSRIRSGGRQVLAKAISRWPDGRTGARGDSKDPGVS